MIYLFKRLSLFRLKMNINDSPVTIQNTGLVYSYRAMSDLYSRDLDVNYMNIYTSFIIVWMIISNGLLWAKLQAPVRDT